MKLIEKLPPVKDHLIFWPIVVVGVALDLWTKSAVFDWLSGRANNEYTVIDGILTLVMRVNYGAAFSIAYGQTTWLIIISVVALIAVVVMFLAGSIQHRLMLVALAMFTSGIIGNLYDRVFNEGGVRDFIDVVYYPGKHWPAFNVADSLLCIAVGLMIISSITSEVSRKPGHPHTEERQDQQQEQ